MQLTFYGAAGEVTGSCSLLETGKYKILIDCGMFQGTERMEAKNADPLPFNPAELTHVFVTHAHLDHVGRLPVLVKNGYQGHFYATPPTTELAKLTLDDTCEIMAYDNRKFGKPILYQSNDVAEVVSRFKGVRYGEPLVISSGSEKSLSVDHRDEPTEILHFVQDDKTDSVRVILHDAGHIFGSAFVEIQAEGKKIVFSGDVGNIRVPILRDTEELPRDLDMLVCEATYGDRLHEAHATREEMIEQAIVNGVSRGGVLMIPSFALERTQELIYELNKIIDQKHRLGDIPIYLDSPLAIDAIAVYRKYPEYYDEKAAAYFKEGDDIFSFKNLVTTYSREESMKINHTTGPKVIIAGAGMMTGGRILHHALRYLSDEKNTLLLIGYQAEGTLGRHILEGVSPVKIHDEEVPVRCQVKMLGALSAHGDQKKMLSWIEAAKPKQVLLNHTEQHSGGALAAELGRQGMVAKVVSPGIKYEF